MEKKPVILDILTKIFTIFGITVLILCVMCSIFGEDAEGYSEIFSLGSKGLSAKTLFEFLLASAVMNGIETLFMTDTIIKDLSLAKRIVFMFVSAFVSVIIFTVLFGWFPINDGSAWLSFIISFAVCCTVGTLISQAKERSENKQLAEALERLKEESMNG